MSRVEQTIEVDAPLSKVYNQWTQFEDFPTFMGGVDQVEQLDEQHLRWTVSTAGVERSFDAEIVEQIPDEKVAWRSEDGEDHTGSVTFEAIDDTTTRVTVVMSYQPQNWVEKAGDALNVIQRRVGNDLGRFKELIEDETLESGGWRGRIEGRSVEADDPAPNTPSTEQP